MLIAPPPSQARRDLGLAIMLAACAASFGAAWALQPPARAAARPLVILVDLAPPSAAETALDAAVWRSVGAADAPSLEPEEPSGRESPKGRAVRAWP